MKKGIFIKASNSFISLEKTITQICIESPVIFRDIFLEIENKLIFSIDANEISLSKYGLIIENNFGLNCNDKRLITALYKRMMRNQTDEIQRIQLAIENSCMSMIELMANNVDVPLTFNTEIDYQKILSLFQVQFEDFNRNNYLESLINYIKVFCSFMDIKIIISNGLLELLTLDEYSLLFHELELLELVLLDFKVKPYDNSSEKLTIDSDFCII